MARKKPQRRQGRPKIKLIFKKRIEQELPERYYYEAKLEDVWAAYKLDHNNKKIRNALVSRYMSQAETIARQFFYRRMPQYSLSSIDDLVSQAYLGCIDAVKKYNPTLGVPFEIWLRLRVTGSIIDGLRTLQDFPRIIAKYRREIKPLRIKLEQKLSRTPTIEDMCSEYGEDLREILQDPLFSSGVFSQIDNRSEEGFDEPASLLESIPDHRSVLLGGSAEIIDAETKILSIFDDVGRPDLRVVIYGYYFMRCTNAQIARAEDYSVSTAVNKHRQALKILRENLTKQEFREIIGK